MGARFDPPSIDSSGHGSSQHPLLSLVEQLHGYPVTVDTNKNPFQSQPEDLNEHMWYLVPSDQTRDSDACSWKPKGEPLRMPFRDSPIVCWEINQAFLDGNNRETDWMMLQYNITTTNGTFSVCRIRKHLKNAQVGGPVPGENHLHVPADVHPFPIIADWNLSKSDLFSRGDFLELLDLDIPQSFPSSNPE
ncbi:hypothetical protein MLD38_034941 [Melastoma candidum]|uniref:Uncharacterized protein n=1 Tax=Melastoma candidum TaxID=119954 RepID=A0ACB9MC37_9MYRT|nr:hypothetical protein MLD38_034941 [Melastoma candidum]